MATQMDPKELDLQEQLARIREMGANFDKSFAEMRHWNEEARHRDGVASDKIVAEIERIRLDAEKIRRETETMGRTHFFQAGLAVAALLGAGAAVAKLFFP